MVKKNLLSLLFLFSILISFNSCEVKDFEEDDFDFDELFYGYKWKATFHSDHDGNYYHQIVFNLKDGRGTESFIYEDRFIYDEHYDFDWLWSESDPHTIEIYYDDGKDGIFTNIWINDDFILTGKLNGENVTFE